MKYILEFGKRGGLHVDNLEVPTKKLARKLARNIQMVLSQQRVNETMWERDAHRTMWQSDTHFVAITKTGSIDGPASASLWRVK